MGTSVRTASNKTINDKQQRQSDLRIASHVWLLKRNGRDLLLPEVETAFNAHCLKPDDAVGVTELTQDTCLMQSGNGPLKGKKRSNQHSRLKREAHMAFQADWGASNLCQVLPCVHFVMGGVREQVYFSRSSFHSLLHTLPPLSTIQMHSH
ncbi:hypothetical protein BCR33DRAFT_732626 [Rhizoclosmatium globosum]|uniref:Uncharacterized protein n=1 Tax=Rhizoclosmatium globosum TaxID=329046 RepID=A0A1Y2D3W4_9FUNG|nr:hypothetical protein BCR33DRAFT_732626 [Rhizoclosmatium globosum]|eukprot:ORY53844.1 hypothetical protein BCR33DRAFT_732626 [Rhizoclosmatium globosum]